MQKCKWAIIISCIMFLFFLTQRVDAVSARFTPKLIVGYNYNDNVDAVDRSVVDPTMMQWLDWLVGLEGSLKQRSISFTLGGWVGYSQYLSSSGDWEKIANIKAYKYSYYNIDLRGAFQYLNPKFVIDIEDKAKRSRDISELMGTEISEFSKRHLYFSNDASFQIRGRLASRVNGLLRYNYQILNFEEPENELVSQPANSYAHLGYGKIGIRVNPRFVVSVEGQGGERVYDKAKVVSGNQIVEVDVVDYSSWRALLGVNYRFGPRTSLSVSGGAEGRHYFGETTRDLKDTTSPVVKIAFNQSQRNTYNLKISGEYAQSTYGQNLYFTYWQAGIYFKYYFVKTLYASVGFTYKQDYYDRSILNTEDIWQDDRLDVLYLANAGITWDALRKHGVPYLSFSLNYRYRMRDSNIDSADDYVPTFTGSHPSYDTEINYVIFRVVFNPSILIGPYK